jgi:hypothetical protein
LEDQGIDGGIIVKVSSGSWMEACNGLIGFGIRR